MELVFREPMYHVSWLYLENVVSLGAENHDALVEMVMLHCWRWIKDGQWRFDFGLESIVGASMVQVVTKASHKKTKDLQIVHKPVHFPRSQNSEHGLTNVERVPPIVIAHGSVVLFDAQNPAAQNLKDHTVHTLALRKCIWLAILLCKGCWTGPPGQTPGTYEWWLCKCLHQGASCHWIGNYFQSFFKRIKN